MTLFPLRTCEISPFYFFFIFIIIFIFSLHKRWGLSCAVPAQDGRYGEVRLFTVPLEDKRTTQMQNERTQYVSMRFFWRV